MAPRRKKRKAFPALSLLLLLLLAAIGIGAYLLLAPSTPRSETFVDIAPGTGSRGIAAQLKRAGIIRSRDAFLAMRLFKTGTLKAGEYRFADAATMSEIYDRLQRGDVYFRVVTIPEGFNIFDVAAAVEASGLATKDDFLAAARKDIRLVADIDPRAQTLEGYLFPDTYHFQRQETADQMAAAMVKRFRQEAQQLGLTGPGAAKDGATKDDATKDGPAKDVHAVVTLASLVEKETPIESDRPLVASVLDNRLKQGMPLMTDPTVIYAAMLQHRYRGAIYQSDLQAQSDYNTYKHTGLPPGPICNPGVAALTAALHPAESKYLYFVADPAAQGHSKFAETLEEHNRNVQAYRRAQHASAAQP